MLPMTELALLMKLGEYIGLVRTLGIIILTGAIGAGLAKWQGVQILQRIQTELSRGVMPAPELVDGLLVLVAGAVLLTPGILTDLFGFLLLVPTTRKIFKTWAMKLFKRFFIAGKVDVTHFQW